MTGWVKIVGLGPGAEELVTAQVQDALAQATDVIGYIPYVARVAPRVGLTLHPSDNRVEIDRANHALELAAQGRQVVVVSSGDPGVFAMASAVFEALEAGPSNWLELDIEVQPGITAMLAAAARIGAPLGHDFCTIRNACGWPLRAISPWHFTTRAPNHGQKALFGRWKFCKTPARIPGPSSLPVPYPRLRKTFALCP